MPKYTWILALIMIVNIFLSSYHFHEWLEFSPDQARDATIANNVITGQESLPLDGPQAGNTHFSLGPLYYETQYFSALIFGNTPQAMAYPDLFFAILSVPMLFLFLKKYFSVRMSLFLTAVFSISYFEIINARSALNQHPISFFAVLFLYALLEIMQKPKGNRLILWYSFLGISVGVGIQLHAILVFTMPVLLILVLVWQWRNKIFSWKGVVFMLTMFLVVNTGQIMHEMTTKASNTKALFKSVASRSEADGSLLHKVKVLAICQLSSDIHMISSSMNEPKCELSFNLAISDGVENYAPLALIQVNWQKILVIFLSAVFLCGGFIILIWAFFRKEKDQQRKNFLGLVAAYNIITLAVLLPVASEIEMRYFVVLIFMPFVLFGLWLNWFLQYKKIGKIIVALIAGLLLATNIYIVSVSAAIYMNGRASNSDSGILGEIEPISRYILDNTGGKEEVYLGGSQLYLKRFFAPLKYLTMRSGLTLVQRIDTYDVSSGEKLFYIDKGGIVNYMYRIGETEHGCVIENIQQFGNLSLLTLRRQ